MDQTQLAQAIKAMPFAALVLTITGCPVGRPGADHRVIESSRLAVATDRDCLVLGAVLSQISEQFAKDTKIKLVNKTLPESQQRILHDPVVADKLKDELNIGPTDVVRFGDQLQLCEECGIYRKFRESVELVDTSATETPHTRNVAFIGFSAPVHMSDELSLVIAWTSGGGESATTAYAVENASGAWRIGRELLLGFE